MGSCLPHAPPAVLGSFPPRLRTWECLLSAGYWEMVGVRFKRSLHREALGDRGRHSNVSLRSWASWAGLDLEDIAAVRWKGRLGTGQSAEGPGVELGGRGRGRGRDRGLAGGWTGEGRPGFWVCDRKLLSQVPLQPVRCKGDSEGAPGKGSVLPDRRRRYVRRSVVPPPAFERCVRCGVCSWGCHPGCHPAAVRPRSGAGGVAGGGPGLEDPARQPPTHRLHVMPVPPFAQVTVH